MCLLLCAFCVRACCSIAVLFALQPLALSFPPLQTVFIPMLWMFTTVQPGHGRRLSSAQRAIFLQLHRSGTWLCSGGVPQQVRYCRGRRGGRLHSLLCAFCVRSCCSIAVLFALQPLALSFPPLQMLVLLMSWTFTATPPQLPRARLPLPPLVHQQQPHPQHHRRPPPPPSSRPPPPFHR